MVTKKTSQTDKPGDPATERLLEALWRAADTAFRLSEAEFDSDRVVADQRVEAAPKLNVEALGRTVLKDQADDLATME